MEYDRVLLINSTADEFQSEMPLGIMTVGTIVQQDLGLRAELHYLPAPSVTSDDFVKTLRIHEGVAFVGMSTMCNTLPRSLSIAWALKSIRPELPVVMGGPQASSVPQELMSTYAWIDGIVVGECERVLTDLWRGITDSVRKIQPGLIYVPPGEARAGLLIANVAPAPLIDPSAIRPIDYALAPARTKEGERGVSVEVGRGCPYQCTFCSTAVFFQRRFRFRPPEDILREVRRLQLRYGDTKFEFVHDMFTTNHKLVEGLCRRILADRLEIDWACSARTDRIDDELLDLMRKAGCRRIFFGVETGSKNMQHSIKKRLDPGAIRSAVHAAWTRGIGVTASMIIGFPDETEQDLADTLNLALEFKSWRPKIRNVQIHFLSPLAGTELTSRYQTSLKFDGFLSDVAITADLTEWEKGEVVAHPSLFSSFYYFPNAYVDRGVHTFLYWFFYHLHPFDEPLRFLYERMGNDVGPSLIAWCRKCGHTPPELPSAAGDPERAAPIVRNHLRSFVDTLPIEAETRSAICDSIDFEYWRNVQTVYNCTHLFESEYDYSYIDTVGLEYFCRTRGPRHLYALRPRAGRLVRIPSQQLAGVL